MRGADAFRLTLEETFLQMVGETGTVSAKSPTSVASLRLEVAVFQPLAHVARHRVVTGGVEVAVELPEELDRSPVRQTPERGHEIEGGNALRGEAVEIGTRILCP